MNAPALNFDLLALAEPKSRQDLIALANEIIAELDNISAHIERAIARCEEQRLAA